MSSMDISASGLSAQRTRLDIIAKNIANAETTRTPDGTPYRRLQAILAEAPNGEGVTIAEIAADQQTFPKVYEPGHPDADADGYVQKPNVDPVTEMVDLVSATRLYEANITTLNASKAMTRKALELGRG